MKVHNIYQTYQIMPQLMTHMLRVAGVAKLITNDWSNKILATECVNACLLHDMGNMAKFDLTKPLIPVEDITAWQKKQLIFWEKYGREAHAATNKILLEMGLPKYIEIMNEESAYYNKATNLIDFNKASKPALLVLYSDLRVIPSGVVSLEERIRDLDRRYPGSSRPEKVWGRELQEYVQSLTGINVATISEPDVIPLFDELLGYNIAL